MASNSKWPRSDTQNYTPQGHKSSGMSNATCWDYLNNNGLGSFDYQDSRRSFHSRQTAEYAIPDDLSNKSDPSYSSIRDPQYYTASSSTEKGRRTGTEGYPMQAWQYPPAAEDQTWKQNLAYSGQQQFFEEYYLHSGQPTQSDSYPTDFGDTYHPQQYSPSYAPSSHPDNNRMPSSYLPFITPVARPSIVVDEAQDDHIYSQRDDQSSLYQECTNVFSASRRVASVGLDAQRSSTRTPNRNHRHHRTHNDMTDPYDLEQSAEGKLSVPRASRRGQREDDCQRRRRHLTPEGREHAKDVRKAKACKDCRRRKIKCRHVLERDQVSTPSSPGVQRDTPTSPHPSSSPQSFHYHSPLTVQSALFPPAMNGFPYCPSPSPLPKAYTEQIYPDHHRRYQ